MNTRKVIRNLLILPAAIYLLYAVPVNLFLFLRLAPWLASAGEGKSFNVNYGFAWSTIPGVVRVRNLKLDGTDDNVHWEVRLRDLTLRPHFPSLRRRALQIRELDAHGVRVDIRKHLENEKAKVKARLQEGEDPNSVPNPWFISIHQIDLQKVEHVQLDDMKFSGNSSIYGDFSLLPGTRLEIPASGWKMESGFLHAGEATLLSQMESDATVVIHPTDLTKTKGSQVFFTMDIHQKLKAQVQDARLFGTLINPYRSLLLSQAQGTLTSDVTINGGVMQPGSHLEAILAQLDLSLPRARLFGNARLNWEVKETRKKPRADFSLILKDADWKSTAAGMNGQRNLARVPLLTLTGNSTELSVLDPFSDLSLKLSAKNAQVTSLHSMIRQFVGGKKAGTEFLESARGVLSIEGDIRPTKKSFSGRMTYATPEFTLKSSTGKTRLLGALDTGFAISSPNYDSGKFNLGQARFGLKDIRIIHEGEEEYSAKDWKADIGLDQGTIETQGAFHLKGGLRIGLTDIKVPLRYALPGNFWVKVGLFLVPMKDLQGKGDLEITPTGTRLTGFNADSSSGRIEGGLRSVGEGLDFSILLRLHPIPLCVSQLSPGEADVSSGSVEKKCKEAEAKIGALPDDA